MKKTLVTLLTLVLTASIANVALADQLRVTVDVASSGKPAEIVGADIYANIDGKLTEITVTPDGTIPFKLNGKFGALRIKSFWGTRNQMNGKDDKPVAEEVK